MVRMLSARAAPARPASFGLAHAWRAAGVISSAALAWAIGGPNAQAQCAPDPAPAGSNVTCRGTDTDGFSAVGNNISVTVEAGATVQGTGTQVIRLNSPGGTFTNRGFIAKSSGLFFDPAVRLIGGTFNSNAFSGSNLGTIQSSASGLELSRPGNFDNSGSITAAVEGVQLESGFAGTFTNSGTVSAQGGTALAISTSSITGTTARTSIVNTASGQIRSSTAYGINIFGGDIFDVTNSGLIQGGLIGIALSANSTLQNNAGGTIEGINNTAVVVEANFNQPAAIIRNAGTIRGLGVAISGASFSLTNSGEIHGDVLATSSRTAQLIVNTGRITGSILTGDGNESFENGGTLAGSVNLGEGADVFRDYGGSISGVVDLGPGDDFVLVKTGMARGAITGGIIPGLGLDSFGVSVEGKETVTLAPTSGFEGVALEARYATSEATLAAGSAPLTQTASFMGDGASINRAEINVAAGDAVRFYSNFRSGSGAGVLLSGPFGNGVSFINEGTITAAPSGFAIHSIGPALTDFGVTSGGNDRLENRGQITGRIMLDAGNDTLINSGQIIGDIALGFSTSQGFDDNLLINYGRINGSVLFAMGSDRVINSGQITGTVNLVFGDDAYLVDLDAAGPVSAGAIDAGPGLDVFGVRSARTASISQGVAAGFEGLGVMADGKTAQITILAPPTGQTLPYLRVFGSGTVINNADILNSNASNFTIVPTVAVVDDGATFINNGVLSGFQALRLAGSGQAVTNNANLQRGAVGGDSTGNTGVIQDAGIGNTLVNNGAIDVTMFSTSAVFIGFDTFAPFGAGTDTSKAPVTRFINNGQLNSTKDFGLRLNTNYAVDIQNTGRIDDIGIQRSEGGIVIRNSATGSIGSLGANNVSSAFNQGGVSIINDGVLGDTATTQMIFRDATGIALTAGYADTIVNSGTLRGVVQMNTGADTFVMRNAGVLQGTVDGGADIDTLGFDGVSGAIRASQFSNFERLDIATPTFAVLDANSGLSSSLKDLVVRNGLVRAETNLAMNVNVLSGGVLGGNGAITGNVVVDGALSPGASVGVLTINGALTLGPQSATLIESDASGTDRIIVNGAAQLGGALRVQASAHPTRIRSLNFMSVSGATTGAFSSIAYDVPGGFSGLTKLIQDASGQISVQITPQLRASATASAGAAVAGGYFNRVILGGQGGAASDQILAQLFALSNSPSSQAFALETIGPTTYAAAPWLGSRQALALTDIVRPRLLAKGAAEPGVTAWLSASQASSSAKTRADVGAAGFKASATPVVAGVEYSGHGVAAGVFAGSMDGKQTLILGRGATKTDGLTAGVYAGLRNGPAHAGLSGAYVDGQAKSIRGMPFMGQVATSEFGLKTWVVQADTAFDFDYEDVLRLTPVVAATFTHVARDAVSETGSAAALDVPEASEDFLHVEAGLQAMANLEINSNFTLRPSLWLGRRLELTGASPTAHGALAGTSDPGLIAWSATPVRSRLTARLGLEGEFSNRLSGFVRYEGEFGRRESDDAISAGLSLRF